MRGEYVFRSSDWLVCQSVQCWWAHQHSILLSAGRCMNAMPMKFPFLINPYAYFRQNKLTWNMQISQFSINSCASHRIEDTASSPSRGLENECSRLQHYYLQMAKTFGKNSKKCIQYVLSFHLIFNYFFYSCHHNFSPFVLCHCHADRYSRILYFSNWNFN